MDGYTPIPDEAALKKANENNMQIFKKKEDGSAEEVTENKESFVEGELYTKNEVASPINVESSSPAATELSPAATELSPAATELSPAATEPKPNSDAANKTSTALMSLAKDTDAMNKITEIVTDATTSPDSGGRRRTKHKKGGKKSHKKGKSSKKVAKRRKSRKTGSRRSRKQNKH
jgi:hypothetical protein